MCSHFAKGWSVACCGHQRALEMTGLPLGFLERWHAQGVMQTYEALVHAYTLTAHERPIGMCHPGVDVVQQLDTVWQICHVGKRQRHQGRSELRTAI
jgi:hypothetical protein